ncbi:hypothetical protein [uncultured Arthrobacter sp.]|nr:hypothetical protein [uncultured Arthrobacter sp.]
MKDGLPAGAIHDLSLDLAVIDRKIRGRQAARCPDAAAKIST